MTHFLQKRDRWGHGMALWVMVAIVFIAPLAAWSLRDIGLENNIQTWLPADDPEAKKLQWYLANFEHEDRILVSWDGSSLNDPRIERFAMRLEGIPDEQGIRRGGLKQVASVATPHEVLSRTVDANIEPEEAIRRMTGLLIGRGPLKVQLSATGREQKRTTIRRLTEKAKSELGLDIEIQDAQTEWVPPDGYFDDETETATEPDPVAESITEFAQIPEHDFQVRWTRINPGAEIVQEFIRLAEGLRDTETASADGGDKLIASCFFAAGSPVALSISLTEAGLAEKTASLAAIRQIAQEVGVESDQLHLGGRPVASAALSHEIKAAAWNREFPVYQIHKRSVILLSSIVGFVLAFVMLRSVRLAMLVLFTSYYTVLVTVALVPVTGGSMNMVLVVMPTLLQVLTISGAIHVANYWRHAVREGKSNATVHAAEIARTPCGLASITTAIGLLSLTTSSLAPVRDFGLYSAVGCLIGLVMVLYGLPAMLQIWPSRSTKDDGGDVKSWQQMGRWLTDHKTIVTAASLLIFAVTTYGLVRFRTETKVIRYFPEDSRVVQDYHFLEENLANIVPVELIVKFDSEERGRLNFLERMEVVREIGNKVRQHPEISGAVSLADFRPVSEKRPDSKSIFVLGPYNKRVNETERRVKEDSSSHRFLSVANDAADLAKEGDNGLNKAGDELWRITGQVAIMSDFDYANLTSDLDDVAQSVLKYHPGAGHVVTGMVPLFLKTQQAVLDSLIRSFALAFGVIAIVMMIVLRNPVAGLITMLPNLMPIGIVFGLISWVGISVDIGTMITASVALGIAVDGTLHLLTWFRNGIADGLDRKESVARALGHCGPALWQTSCAVGIGLLMLAPADLLLISRFGWLMAALIGAALVADLVFLPALLAGPLGTLIERTTKAKQLVESNKEEEASPAIAETSQTETPQPHLSTTAKQSIES